MSDEAVAGTHVRMALETAHVLANELAPDQAIMLYIRAFNLPAVDGQVVFRRAMSQWAELHPLQEETQAPARPPAEAQESPKLALRSRREFGLRVIV
jgi:hypothetical protein